MSGICVSQCLIGYYAASQVTNSLCVITWHVVLNCIDRNTMMVIFVFGLGLPLFQLVLTQLVMSLQGLKEMSDEPICKACDVSCIECRGPSKWDCTVCPTQQILSDDGRCLSCCGNQTWHHDKPIPWECCDCMTSQGK